LILFFSDSAECLCRLSLISRKGESQFKFKWCPKKLVGMISFFILTSSFFKYFNFRITLSLEVDNNRSNGFNKSFFAFSLSLQILLEMFFYMISETSFLRLLNRFGIHEYFETDFLICCFNLLIVFSFIVSSALCWPGPFTRAKFSSWKSGWTQSLDWRRLKNWFCDKWIWK
jgi:hypothetical protein